MCYPSVVLAHRGVSWADGNSPWSPVCPADEDRGAATTWRPYRWARAGAGHERWPHQTVTGRAGPSPHRFCLAQPLWVNRKHRWGLHKHKPTQTSWESWTHPTQGDCYIHLYLGSSPGNSYNMNAPLIFSQNKNVSFMVPFHRFYWHRSSDARWAPAH